MMPIDKRKWKYCYSSIKAWQTWPAVQKTRAWNLSLGNPPEHGIEPRMDTCVCRKDRRIRVCDGACSTNYKYSTVFFRAMITGTMPPIDLERAVHPGPDQVHRTFCFLSLQASGIYPNR